MPFSSLAAPTSTKKPGHFSWKWQKSSPGIWGPMAATAWGPKAPRITSEAASVSAGSLTTQP